MARWRLTANHYLNVEGTRYHFKEALVGGGEAMDQTLAVPRLLEVDNPRDWTDRAEGVIVVAHAGSNVGRDLVFKGDPTPDMVPLDAEAEEITNRLRAGWDKLNTVDLRPGEDYSKVLVDKLMEKSGPAEPHADIKALLESNQAVISMMTQVVGNLAGVRRV